MLSSSAQANLLRRSQDRRPHAQTYREISGVGTLSNSACPICMARRTARWKATVLSGNQTAPGGRAAHTLSERWESTQFPPAAREVRDDYRVAPPEAAYPLLLDGLLTRAVDQTASSLDCYA